MWQPPMMTPETNAKPYLQTCAVGLASALRAQGKRLRLGERRRVPHHELPACI